MYLQFLSIISEITVKFSIVGDEADVFQSSRKYGKGKRKTTQRVDRLILNKSSRGSNCKLPEYFGWRGRRWHWDILRYTTRNVFVQYINRLQLLRIEYTLMQDGTIHPELAWIIKIHFILPFPAEFSWLKLDRKLLDLPET